MANTLTRPVDVPPLYLQNLVSGGLDSLIRCAQALGSEVYVGCEKGEIMRFALQADDPNKPPSYTLLSRQTIATNKSVDEIVLIPGISRAFILSDNQIHFYTLPSLDAIHSIKPIRNVVTFAIDQRHLRRPPSLNPSQQPDTVEFSVIKRNSIQQYSLRAQLFFVREMPLPQGGSVAVRVGHNLCLADKAYYNIVDLERAVIVPIMPLSQAEDTSVPVKPSITLVSDNEYLILSWTGSSTLGVFINTEGDPTRGTLEWPSHPKEVCFDPPYVATLLPNQTIEIHSVETQSIIQVLPAPTTATESTVDTRVRLMSCLGGYHVPSSQRSSKMQKCSVPLLRNASATV